MRNNDEILLKDFKHSDGTLVCEWESKPCKHYCKFFYKYSYYNDLYKVKTILGFEAYLLRYMGWKGDGEFIEVIFRATALFDGVSLLSFAEAQDKEQDRDGYIYYPNIDSIIDGLNKLKELCKTHNLS